MTHNPALRRYNRTVILLSIVYALLLFAAVWLFKHDVLRGVPAYVAAVLPALPIIAIFAAIGRYFVEERDEYLRVMMVRQSLIATGFSLSVATAWGFLENFDLVPHVYAYYATILWFAGLGLGSCVNRLRSAPGEGE